MERFAQMAGLQAVLLIYLLGGVLCRKRAIITAETQQRFCSLVLDILMPCMVFNSFRSITPDVLAEAAEVFFISLGLCLVSWALGKVLYTRFEPRRQGVLRYATLINNAGFAGLPLVHQALGDEGLIYASVFLIPIRFFMWSAGITMLSGERVPAGKLVAKLAKNPNIVAVFLGLARGLLQLSFPDPVESAIAGLAACVSPMSMLIVGAIIASVDVRTVVEPCTLGYSAVRLVLLPLLSVVVTRLLGVGEVMAGACLIITAMPAATSTALLASQHGADEGLASKLVFVSTVLSLVTVPPLMLLV